jgi:hypothetical protein
MKNFKIKVRVTLEAEYELQDYEKANAKKFALTIVRDSFRADVLNSALSWKTEATVISCEEIELEDLRKSDKDE